MVTAITRVKVWQLTKYFEIVLNYRIGKSNCIVFDPIMMLASSSKANHHVEMGRFTYVLLTKLIQMGHYGEALFQNVFRNKGPNAFWIRTFSFIVNPWYVSRTISPSTLPWRCFGVQKFTCHSKRVWPRCVLHMQNARLPK